ncbi:hypothetical protein NX059_004970 [Plenodomus lindquistii]|nr:hypothetical protein NX059_004970 [Plenodomus lindquistii]
MWSFLPILALSATILASSIDKPKYVPGKYLVRLQPGTSAAKIATHHDNVRRLARRSDVHEPVERTFSIGDLNVYLGDLDEQAASEIANLEEVLSVVPDEYVYIEKTDFAPLKKRRKLTTQSPSIWSLGDLSHKEAGSTEYVYDSTAGEGTTAYVFDTGIRLTHQEFEGRARFGINGISNSVDPSGASNDTDGHGTHCAATVAGKTYGVAKNASLVDVKIFDGAAGTTSWFLTGIEWAINDVVSRGAQNTSVFSMSFGAQTSSDLHGEAIKAAYDAGILSIVSAGNSNQPIEEFTPARIPEAFTVGMTQPDRGRVNIYEDIYGSNYGPEMDVFAPGRDIISASHLSDNGTATKTGTKGGLASPQEVGDRILSLALKDVVGDPRGSPNLLVNNGSGA